MIGENFTNPQLCKVILYTLVKESIFLNEVHTLVKKDNVSCMW